MKVSAVIIVKNGAATIERTLESLHGFDDVVVYDNGSEDGTQELVKHYGNVNLIEGEFLGFGATKNLAASYAKSDWVFIIDSDEVLDDELFQTLRTKRLDSNTVYVVNSIAYYKEIQIKHSGWNKEKVRRIYNRSMTQFNNNLVHETIMDDGMKLAPIKGNIQHYSYRSISDFIIKADHYSTLFAQDNAGKRSSSPSKALFNGLYSFFRTYLLRRGFLDGYAGLLIAFSHMATNFYKYMKLYELNKEIEERSGEKQD